jgi:hypothetical protein
MWFAGYSLWRDRETFVSSELNVAAGVPSTMINLCPAKQVFRFIVAEADPLRGATVLMWEVIILKSAELRT